MLGAIIKGHGVDLVDIEEFYMLISGDNEVHIGRYFTDVEINRAKKEKYFKKEFAIIFAIKEAVIKALGVGLKSGVSFVDVEVVRDQKTTIILKRKLARIEEDNKIKKWFISSSNTNTMALASVIAVSYN